MTSHRPYDRFKRAIDIFGASILFALTLPLQTAIAILVRKKLGSPVLFRQHRPGLHGKTFNLVKFRTMRDSREGGGSESDEDRLTPFGQRLRSLSLDELPTLLNVIRGDMSLVGPRPLLISYLERYSTEQARRHEVRPGVTGLAQVSGRNSLSWDEKFRLDVEYVDNRGLKLDVAILARTIAPVLGRHGINEVGAATMTEFEGHHHEQ